jgi:hypothetical protein
MRNSAQGNAPGASKGKDAYRLEYSSGKGQQNRCNAV